MRTGFQRLTGIVIFIGAVMGLVLSMYGLYGLWAGKEQVSTTLIELVDLSGRTVDSTSTMLLVVSDSLEQAGSDLALIEEILIATARTIGESNTLVDTTAGLMGEDLPTFIRDTQTSLTSVQSTARVVDDMLSTITRIPLLGPFLGQRYSPEVPLATTVANVKSSLDPLPATFTSIQREMEVASASLDTVRGELEALGSQIAEIDDSIDAANLVVAEYRIILSELNSRLDALQMRLPALIDTVYLALTIVLIWVGVSQLGALLHALALVQT